MRTHETEAELAGRTRAAGVARREVDPGMVGRALADGRVGDLGAPAVHHLQASAGNASVSRLIADEEGPSKVMGVVGAGRGEHMDPATAQRMESEFGEDFSDVRIHRDAAASDSARAMRANAYTVGSDIVFDTNRYDPSSDAGGKMLAHELTHVVQQRTGPVDGSAVGGGVSVSDPSDRFERAATQVGDRVGSASAASASPAPAASAQRDAAPEAAALTTAQRATAPAEDELPDDEAVPGGPTAQRATPTDEDLEKDGTDV